MRYRKPPDFAILLVVLVLLCFGIVMVFSSSSVWAYYMHKDSLYFLKRQLVSALLGLIAMVYFMNYDYWKIKKYEKIILLVMYLLLILVLIPGIGMKINEARRWIGVGAFSVQPSEIAKLGMVVYLSCALERKQEDLKNFLKGLLPVLLVTGITCGLVLVEPHLSATVLIGMISMVMIFTAGANMSHLLLLGAIGIIGVVVLIIIEPYRMVRLLSFLNPWEDIRGKGYNIVQSLYALGAGGLIGVGLGQSRQKFFYLPEPQTDFIFAIIGEELGFLGSVFVILMFTIFIWRGYKTALHAPDLFGKFMATGITSLIAFQFLIHVAVVTASMPVTGMPLPFISYGGSSLTITLAEVGILLNITRYSEAK
ncbi:stage V sporulation protein E [Thermosediminibacter oceani]|uniref:Spore cortex peptidoglycan biosynthesis regulator SpoVE n=1 Tax=Thermosediminibacter oceani (strain ATCC BAA-1034 / DSM 16646 / JW/IW-1228P) TaxID=555079 RepID=D9S2T6_THEOJ|nr:stage V sporulation protein E [Thermosediminibacter oceani]ADL07713.1 spore cortex peptidoglycan biosynthesis regulator SpoVE [Thermosediminibacter oceani DSM 16646]